MALSIKYLSKIRIGFFYLKVQQNLTSKYLTLVCLTRAWFTHQPSWLKHSDQTNSIAGQLWRWRELDESSRHLHKLFILPYFTAIWLSMKVIQDVLILHFCAVVLFAALIPECNFFVAEVLEPSAPKCNKLLTFLLDLIQIECVWGVNNLWRSRQNPVLSFICSF